MSCRPPRRGALATILPAALAIAIVGAGSNRSLKLYIDMYVPAPRPPAGR